MLTYRSFGTSCLFHCDHLIDSTNSEDGCQGLGCGAYWLLLSGARYKYSYLLTYNNKLKVKSFAGNIIIVIVANTRFEWQRVRPVFWPSGIYTYSTSQFISRKYLFNKPVYQPKGFKGLKRGGTNFDNRYVENSSVDKMAQMLLRYYSRQPRCQRPQCCTVGLRLGTELVIDRLVAG